ncbi:MAG: hypothetical protein GTO49_17225 [Anaerolineae bacterium]|nr:hypothetical protein [Anaerolineae bacterium]
MAARYSHTWRAGAYPIGTTTLWDAGAFAAIPAAGGGGEQFMDGVMTEAQFFVRRKKMGIVEEETTLPEKPSTIK